MILIKSELVDIKNVDGEWMKVVGKVLVDIGNEVWIGIFGKFVSNLGLKLDLSKKLNVFGVGGMKVKCSGIVIIEVKVWDYVFLIEVLVDLLVVNVDFLIGKDIIDVFFYLNYIFGK